MAETLWKWRVLLFATPTAASVANRNTFAQVFVDTGGGETLANEKLMFDHARRLALAASPTVLAAYGISFPVKESMRDGLQAAIVTMNAPLSAANKVRWYAIAAIDLPNFSEGDLVQSNRSSVDNLIGTPFTWANALSDLGLVKLTE